MYEVQQILQVSQDIETDKAEASCSSENQGPKGMCMFTSAPELVQTECRNFSNFAQRQEKITCILCVQSAVLISNF